MENNKTKLAVNPFAIDTATEANTLRACRKIALYSVFLAMIFGFSEPLLADMTKTIEFAELQVTESSIMRSRAPDFNSCDALQQDFLVGLTGLTETRVADVIAELQSLPQNQRTSSPRFERWFGRHTQEHYAAVQNGYTAILTALTDQTLNYDCSCVEGDLVGDLPTTPVAYVNGEYSVTFCPSYFHKISGILPVTYENYAYEVGVLVHETSHFGQVLNTQDFYLSGLDASDLSLSAPSAALNNAANWEMFAVNSLEDQLENDGTTLPQRFPQVAPPVSEVRPKTIALLPEKLARGLIENTNQALYSVTGAPFVILTSLVGNADLYVYTDASLSEETLVCSSIGVSVNGRLGLDICEVDATRTYYILVDHFPYGDDASNYADYAIIATATPPNYGLGDPTIGSLLRLDSPFVSSMGSAAFQSFYVSGAISVTIQANNGILTFIVDSAATPFSNSPICQIEVSSATASNAVCELSADDDYMVRVLSFPTDIDGQYQFELLASSFDGPSMPDLTDTPDTPDTPTDNTPMKKKSSGLGAEWLWLIMGSGLMACRGRKLSL